jgi:hypothetical protein
MERHTGIWPEVTDEAGAGAGGTPDTPPWWPYGAEFPHWRVWRGTSGLLHARQAAGDPAGLVSGEDPVDLRDQIRRADARELPANRRAS